MSKFIKVKIATYTTYSEGALHLWAIGPIWGVQLTFPGEGDALFNFHGTLESAMEEFEKVQKSYEGYAL